MTVENKEKRTRSEAEIVRELRKYYDLLFKADNSRKEIFRNISGAILDNINHWCGNFVPEYNEIILAISKALVGEIDYINPGEAYYVGDYLMSIIMAAEDMDDARAKLYNVITENRLHKEAQLHIAWLIE